MAQPVVVVLEAVEVHHQQPNARCVGRVGVRVLEQLRQVLLEGPVVAESGQRIGLGADAHRLVRLRIA